MSQSIVTSDDDLRRAVSALSADVAAALALSRVALQAVASQSAAHCAAAELALEDELERAHEFSAIRTVEVLEDARARIQGLPEQMHLLSVLEQALHAAAAALPDLLEAEDPDATLRPQ